MESRSPHEQPPWTDRTASSDGGEVSGLAVTSLVMGILGFVCFPGVAGVAAMACGIAARSEIERSGGRRSGRGIALTGIVLGTASVVLAVLGLGALITLTARARSSAVAPHPPATRTPAPPPIGTPHHAPSATPSTSPPPAGVEGVRTVQIGKVVLVDLGPGVVSLDDELGEQRRLAEQDHKKVLLWVSHDDCAPCNGVAAALRDSRLQSALANTWLVRLDVRDYRVDLETLGIPTRFIPGFALLDENNRPVDYLHGGEWDDDIPQNIAPVLGAFVRGTYADRRHPFSTFPESDTTPIGHSAFGRP